MLTKLKANWQDILIGLLLTGILILGFLITYLGLQFFKKPGVQTTSFEKVTPAPINDYTKEEGVYNILLLGYGGAGHSGGGLTDSIIVAHINSNKKTAALISIPRDLWVNGGRKINAEGSINGFDNVDPLITTVTGLPINYYVAVDFGGFSKLIDNLGGITVSVPKTFDDAFYPITGEENNTCGKTEAEINTLKAKYSGFELEKQFTCRYEQIHFDKGQTSLDGKTALKFVRSRHGDSDFGRSERQFAVLKGILGKLISIQSAGNINKTIDTLSKIVKADMNLGVIKSLIDVFEIPGEYKITEVQLTTDNVLNSSKSSDGQFILVPKTGNLNFSGIKSYIRSQLQ